MLCNSGSVSGLGRVSVNPNLYPGLKLTPGGSFYLCWCIVGAIWLVFFPIRGGGEQFWGNLGWLSPIYRSNLESNLAFFPIWGAIWGNLGGNLAGLPPKWGVFSRSGGRFGG